MNVDRPAAGAGPFRLPARTFLTICMVALLAGCEPQPPAPVIDGTTGDALPSGSGDSNRTGQALADARGSEATAAAPAQRSEPTTGVVEERVLREPEPRRETAEASPTTETAPDGGAVAESAREPAPETDSAAQPRAATASQNQAQELLRPPPADGDGRPGIALLLPVLDSSPRRSALAVAMGNAARLAMEDLGEGAPRLQVYDTTGGAGSAADAARRAIDDGAELLLGPLTSGKVREIRPVLRESDTLALAFSTDSGAAGDGVYLVGSLPTGEFRRILRFAAVERGYRTLGAILPDNAYGAVARRALDRVASETGSRVSAVVTYDGSFESARQAALDFADLHQSGLGSGDGRAAVLVPESGSLLATVAAFLSQRGMLDGQLQLLGTGVWDAEATVREDALHGGWFSAPDPSRRGAFSERYRERYGTRPPLLAAFAYDAAAAAGGLLRDGGGDAIDEDAITNPSGFLGTAGAFRFTRSGLNERALAVLSVEREGFRILDPAPEAFAGY